MLAELDAQGNTQREYLYLQSWPVAVVSYTPAVPAGSGTAALLVGDAAAETAEDYPEVAETAPADPKPTTSTGVTTSATSDRAADGVATSTATTPAIQLHYLHPDHLGTPRLATDSAQRIVWRWDSAPFGDTPAQEDPDGDGVRVTLNLRFPGQYFDAETGLHYNYFRDYDPVVGRYLESDPIGLRGGVNTYGYVGGRPLVGIDPEGLKAKGQWINGTPRIGNEYIVPTGAHLLPLSMQPDGWPMVDDWGFVHVLRVHGKAGGRLFCSVRCTDEDGCSSTSWDMHNSYGFSATGHVDVGPNVYGAVLGLLFKSPWSNVQVNLSLSFLKSTIAASALYARYQRAVHAAYDSLILYGPDSVCNNGWPSLPRF